MTQRTFQMYRYDPDKDAKPYMQTIAVELDGGERMLLDALIRIKEKDDTLSLRRSCREGVCGSDAMNINGKNGLACITKLADLKEPVMIRPLPGLPVIRDLIVDMSQFFKQYHSIKPYLINDEPFPEKERYQSPAEREELDGGERMRLDALMKLKAVDPTLSFRRSCREGVCGSDAMNINGKNGLACLTNMRDLKDPIVLKPLPGLPVVRDLIVDMTQFFTQYDSIKPYLVNDSPPPDKERLQSPEERDELNGLYECILCASCSTSCPSFWWNPDKFVGPAGLLQAYRFIADSRDQDTAARLDNLEDPYRLFRCHTIMNCVDVCPKGLNPTKAIGKIKELMVRRAI